MNFSNMRLQRYINELASPSVAPGGGSAAAIAGALGAALLEMTAGINQKKVFNKRSAKNLKKIKNAREALLKLATADANAFLEFSRLRKEDKQGTAYQNALKQCAQAPLDICRLCCECIQMAAPEVSRTSRWLASDLAEAALFLETAFYAACLNVEINLSALCDAAHVRRVRSQLKTMETKCAKQKDLILRSLDHR